MAAMMMVNKSHVDAKEDECDKVGGLDGGGCNALS